METNKKKLLTRVVVSITQTSHFASTGSSTPCPPITSTLLPHAHAA